MPYEKAYTYSFGGNYCLTGDAIDLYRFELVRQLLMKTSRTSCHSHLSQTQFSGHNSYPNLFLFTLYTKSALEQSLNI